MKGKIDFEDLSDIEIWDASGAKRFESQIEDRNLNNKIDPFDIIAFKGNNQQGLWNGVVIKPRYGAGVEKALHKKLSSETYEDENIIFRQTAPYCFVAGFNNSECADITIKLPGDMPSVANTKFQAPENGLYIFKGPLRTRISLAGLSLKKIPFIQSFVFNSKNRSITSNCAMFAFSGWGHYYLTVRRPELFKNMYPLSAYAYGNVKFLKPEKMATTYISGEATYETERNLKCQEI